MASRVVDQQQARVFHEQTAGAGVSAASNIHNVVAEGNEYRPLNSKRWKTLSHQQAGETLDSVCRGDNRSSATVVNEDLLVSTSSNIQNRVAEDPRDALRDVWMSAKAILWYTDTLKPKSTLEEHSALITDVRFSPSMPRLATSSFNKTVSLGC